MTLDEAIEVVEDAGLSVIRPRNNDELLRSIWEQVHSLLRTMTDLVEDGATLTLTHPAFMSPGCDYRLLTRSAIIGRLDLILDKAVVVKEERADAI